MLPEIPNPDETEIPPPIGIVTTLHAELLRELVDLIGDSIRVRHAHSATHGLVAYGFAAGHCDVAVHLKPYSDQAAILCGDILIGRIIPEYQRALRWLLHNRTNNTVTAAVSEEIVARRELRLSYTRITAPGDPFSIRDQLADMIQECVRTADTLHAWFPQLIDGAWLVKGAARLENSDEESFFRSAISNPRDVLRALEECESDASLRCLLACFAADWQALLMHALDHENESLASGDLEQVASARSMKLTALYRLRRYEEALALANRIGADADEPDGAATARAACLVRLERYRDALDVIESANVENHLRLQFWRACASLGAGEREQSAEAYERYEGQCGPDIRGTKLLRSIMKKIEPPVPPLSLGENTESA